MESAPMVLRENKWIIVQTIHLIHYSFQITNIKHYNIDIMISLIRGMVNNNTFSVAMRRRRSSLELDLTERAHPRFQSLGSEGISSLLGITRNIVPPQIWVSSEGQARFLSQAIVRFSIHPVRVGHVHPGGWVSAELPDESRFQGWVSTLSSSPDQDPWCETTGGHITVIEYLSWKNRWNDTR